MISLAQVWSQALPFQQFHVLFNPLFKVLFIFRSLYLCAIGLWPVFSFRRNLPPALSSIPKLLDSSKVLYRGATSNRTGLSPSMAPRSRGLRRRLAKSILYRLQLGPRRGPDFKSELLPLHSPLLGQSLLVSFPPLIDMLKFSGYPYLIRGQTLKIFASWTQDHDWTKRKNVLRSETSRPAANDFKASLGADPRQKRPTPSKA